MNTPRFISRRALLFAPASLRAFQTAKPALSDAEQERFLREARVTGTKGAPVGITGSKRATLSDGVLTHDAHIQTIDESKARFEVAGAVEINFRDTWKFNVAAYRLDRLLDLRMTPVSIERRHLDQTGSFTWWVDDVLMMEVDRMKQRLSAPDPDRWNCQIQVVRIFDQLICNTDRNLQNLLITKDWNLWMIDHTRAFRLHKKVRNPLNITRCDRKLLARLKELNRPALVERLQPFITGTEIDGLLGRRDHVVRIVDDLVRKQGEQQALYDRA